MNAEFVWYVAPAASLVALAVAAGFFRWMKGSDPGNDRMREIAGFVRQGAMAYLFRQYKIVSLVSSVLILLALVGLHCLGIPGILGLLAGGMVCGFVLATMLNNAGGAWSRSSSRPS